MSLDLHPASVTPRLVVLRQVAGQDRVLTDTALEFLTELQVRFGYKLNALMVARDRRQDRLDQGQMPDYLADTVDIRKGLWTAAALPVPFCDRRSETAGQAPATITVADREDRGPARFSALIGALDSSPTILRPRALDVPEANVMIAGQPISAALFDFGLHVFHGTTAFELAKLESHREARFWNEVCAFAEDRLGLATIATTVCIETLTAAYEMDEIVWELRERITALSLNRANYAASYIRAMRQHADRLLPGAIPHDRAFLATCAARLVKVAHRRGILAIGDAQPEYEAQAGFDGSRSDDPAAALAIYAEEISGPNQLRIPRQGWRIEPEMLAQPHEGTVGPDAAGEATRCAIHELAAWISGQPARMDLAELARMRLWQWQRHGALTADILDEAVQVEVVDLLAQLGPNAFHRGHYAAAARIVQQAITGRTPDATLTARAWPVVNALD